MRDGAGVSVLVTVGIGVGGTVAMRISVSITVLVGNKRLGVVVGSTKGDEGITGRSVSVSLQPTVSVINNKRIIDHLLCFMILLQ